MIDHREECKKIDQISILFLFGSKENIRKKKKGLSVICFYLSNLYLL